jgi:putative transposase
MKMSRGVTYEEVSILKQAEAGTPVADLCREFGMSGASFYQWRSKYGGMDASLMRRLKEFEAENARLKNMYAEEWIKSDLRQ